MKIEITQCLTHPTLANMNQLSGYLNTIMSFAAGLGSSPQDQKFLKAIQILYDYAGSENKQQCLQQLEVVRGLFPPASRADIKNAMISALQVGLQPLTGQSDAVAGFQDCIEDLTAMMSLKDKQFLHNTNFKATIDAFIAKSDKAHDQAMMDVINTVIGQIQNS
jgi:hypothetical protein